MKVRSISDEVQRNVLKELCGEIDFLQKTIETFSRRKSICEGLVRDMTSSRGKDDTSTSQHKDDKESDDSDDEEGEGSGESEFEKANQENEDTSS